MENYHIRGGNPIRGEYTAKGAKNATLPILAASIVTGQRSYFFNCPDISDVTTMQEILTSLGCKTSERDDFLEVDARNVNNCRIPRELMEKMRSSIFLIGPLLARCGKAVICQPGGCAIGARPIDLHIQALKELGVEVEQIDGFLVFTANKLKGTDVRLDFPSVGATENVLVAALAAEGETVIHNCAREPEIIDLQRYLNNCGARINGAGTSKIVVQGREPLYGSCHRIMGDRIEAGTFLMAAAATKGELLVKGIEANHLKSLTKILRFAGCDIKRSKQDIWLKAPERLFSIGRIQTRPYPGFPTDLQPQLVAIMTGAIGETILEEKIFENRFKYTEQLLKMGANVEIFQRTAIIEGVETLQGGQTFAEDLRGGAALVLAGLMAEGETTVENVYFIERGYSNFQTELRKLGGDIW